MFRILVTVWLAASPIPDQWMADGAYPTRRACNEAAVSLMMRLRIGPKDAARVRCERVK